MMQATDATCQSCGAALVPDQRYCLTCGHPCSPVRLAFLDVLQTERVHTPTMNGMSQAGYAPAWEPDGAVGSLQRYTGVFGLLTVLLVAGLIGLLVGHWVGGGQAPTQSVLKIEGLGGLASAAAPAAGTTTTPTVPVAKKRSSAHSEAVAEAAEAAKIKAPPPAPKRAGSNALNKLDHLKGKKYQQEIDKLTEGDQPIETGGG